jgi:YfiH family protein
MIEKKINGLSTWCFSNLLRYEGIAHFVTTRRGGASRPPFHSLNLSFNVGDDQETVLNNRRILAQALGIPLSSLTTARQIHDSHVKIVSEGARGKGSTNDQGVMDSADAMVTNVPGVCLMVLSADCVPLLMFDPAKAVIGVVHAGWKGTLRLIARNTVEVFQEQFGSAPRDIHAAIGPSIGPCCFEVGPEVISQVKDCLETSQACIGKKHGDERGYFDLWTANLRQLVQAGIPEKNIEVARVCTYDHGDVFFSHRREGGKTGRFGAGILIR